LWISEDVIFAIAPAAIASLIPGKPTSPTNPDSNIQDSQLLLTSLASLNKDYKEELVLLRKAAFFSISYSALSTGG
jgi:hypothetical protein